MSDLNATRWMIKLKVAGGVGGEGIDLFLSEGLEIVANGGQSVTRGALSLRMTGTHARRGK